MLSFSRTLLALALFTPFTALAQQPAAPLPVYDAIAIHENKAGANMSMVRWGSDAFTATNTTLTSLLMSAYGIREDLMSGLPSWANSFHFDINAKISDPDPQAIKNLSREQRRAMMVTLLKERFHLQTHIETKTLPVYDLVIAKGGLKLKENATPPATSLEPGASPSTLKPGSFRISNSGTNSEMTAVGVPISNLATNLAFQVERNIIDKTGLTAKYDFNLKWTPMQLEGKVDASADNNAPDIFTALQEQLGLKLEPSKGPVDTLVIDHIEKPSEN
jgi:uncharacterized protein (TIGR03435 family)